MADKSKIPHPVPLKTVCSICGMDWQAHKPSDLKVVGLSDCIRVLQEELARRPQISWTASQQGITHANIPSVTSIYQAPKAADG